MASVGRYERVRMLGRGASGEVWLVRDRARGGQLLAFKQLLAGTDAEGRIRDAFMREFATMASVSAPGVAQVFDFGWQPGEDGAPAAPYFTRAFVDGIPLSEASEAVSAPERAQLVARVLSVLSPLHRAGVTHGDIKPGNVIVDGQGAVHVIDFGLARVLGTGPRRAADGGSPAFMAPELLHGEPPSLASDLYSVGVLLWVTMTGRLPFADADGGGLRQRLSGELPALPADADPCERDALNVALRAMAPDPKARFPSVDEMAVALTKGKGAGADGSATVPRVFVAPRPRGQEPLIGEASRLLSGAVQAAEGSVLLWHGAAGIGKSSLLRELKWQQQMAGTVVFELAAGAGFSKGVRAALLSPLRALLGDDDGADVHAADAAEGEVQAPEAVAETVRRGLRRLPAGAAVLWLVDDIDAAGALLGAVLRELAYGSGGPTVFVVATASERTAPGAAALSASVTREVMALSSADVAALTTDTLGPLDGSVLEAVFAVSQGVPGPLLDALAQLARLPAATSADVVALELASAHHAARARLARVDERLSPLLQLLCLVRVPVPLESLWPDAEERAPLLAALADAQRLGVLQRTPEGIALSAVGLARAAEAELGDRRGAVARELLSATAAEGTTALSPLAQARLWIASGEPEALRRELPERVRKVVQGGDPGAASEIISALLSAGEADSRGWLRGELLRARQALGDHEGCATLARELVEDPEVAAERRLQAAVIAARALTALTRFEEAVAVLEGAQGRRAETDASAPDGGAERGSGAASTAEIASELARVHLRAGDYQAAASAAEVGLAIDPLPTRVHIELLCSAGITAGYRGDGGTAQQHYARALELAEEGGSARDRARVRSYIAIAAYRRGEHETARDLLVATVADAREAGDAALMANASMNLGAIQFHLGDATEAETRYESARKLALRMGNVATALQARTNLAHVHVYFGLFERAQSELASLSEDADGAGHRYVAAQVRAIAGDLAARTGETDRALQHYDDAIARYEALGQAREQLTHQLQAAEALIDRAGPADASAAADRLASARALLGKGDDRAAALQLQLLTARVRVEAGDAEQAVPMLDAVIEGAQAAGERELAWCAHMAAHRAHDALGTGFAGRKHLRAAMEQLEAMVVRLPRDYRDAFWLDPRRRQVRDAAHSLDDASQHTTFDRGAVAATMADPRTTRLLEVVKRLAMERDLDRLLERITEHAVELSGAERGFVLLVDEHEQLVQRTVRERIGASQAASLAFSQSIAEAVLIDGEPLVTTDATVDGRLNEYASVHQLALKSVACLPIQTPERTEGVLYLENRRSRGRFTESVVELLHAFADQAAIALTNARLYAENAAHQRQLEATNAALEHAKRELEETLSARSRQLDEVQWELSQQKRSRARHRRHGMIGDSPPMLHLFSMIDRLCDVAVPVVVEGESGTGKELVARAIHYAGVRSAEPFIAINCGALPETLLESELFGHVKGAFSGADRDRRGVIERASGGTLFLDEVADMPAKMQIDLLRVLQEGTVSRIGGEEEVRVDVRFVAASQRPLRELVDAGQFREDLFYRLHVVQLRLPPLRERRGDIPRLAEHLLGRVDLGPDKTAKRLSADAVACLVQQPWPGNVRQLEHVLLQASVMTDGELITPAALAACGLPVPGPGAVDAAGSAAPSDSHLAVAAEASSEGHEVTVADVATSRSAPPPPPRPPSGRPPGTGPAASVHEHREAEKRRILSALEATGWNRAKAAKALGMARRTFYRRLQEYQIL